MTAEDTLWTGNPGDYTDPKAPEYVSEVRKLVDDGQYAEATDAALKLTGNPSEVCCLIISSFVCSFFSVLAVFLDDPSPVVDYTLVIGLASRDFFPDPITASRICY